MADVVEFTLDLDTEGAVEGASKLDRQIAELTKKLRGLEAPSKLEALQDKIAAIENPMRGVAKASGEAAAAHGKHAHAAHGLDGALQGLTHHFEKIVELVAEWDAAEFLLELPKRLFEIGEEMLITASKAERTEASFKLLFGPQGGAEALEDIEAIGKNTEFAHNRIKALTQDLGKVGFGGEDLKRARAAALDIAAFSSDKEAGLSGAQGALERIKRTGRVDNRVLGGLGIGEKDFMGELAARTGHGVKQLKKELDAGKVDADTSLEALYAVITKKTGKKLGGAGADIAEGLDSTLTHLGELPERYFEKLAHSQGYEKFGEQLKHVLDQLDPDSPQGKRIFSALDDAFSSVGDLIGNVDVAELADDFKTAFVEIASYVKPAVHVLEEVWDIVHKIGLGLGVMGGAINDYVIKPIQAVDGAIKGTAISKAVRGSNWLHDYTPIGYLQDHLGGKAEAAGESVPAGLAKGIMSGGGDVDAAGMSIGYDAEHGTRSALDSHSPSKLFESIGVDTAEGFAMGVDKGSTRMGGALEDLVPTVAASGMGGGARTITIAPSITVHVGGGGSANDTAQAVAAQVADILPAALQSAIDNLAVQSGAS